MSAGAVADVLGSLSATTGATVIVVTHDRQLAARVDLVVELSGGRLAEPGAAPDAVLGVQIGEALELDDTVVTVWLSEAPVDPGFEERATRRIGEVVESGAAVVVTAVRHDLTDADVDRSAAATPAPGYDDDSPTVRHCVRVVFEEECEHRRYTERDLDRLGSR